MLGLGGWDGFPSGGQQPRREGQCSFFQPGEDGGDSGISKGYNNGAFPMDRQLRTFCVGFHPRVYTKDRDWLSPYESGDGTLAPWGDRT